MKSCEVISQLKLHLLTSMKRYSADFECATPTNEAKGRNFSDAAQSESCEGYKT